jgi:altered-inheritance-of-mitochondria protein 13
VYHQPQTDVSRSQTLELQIQARVAAELRRLQEEEAAALREATEKLSALPPTPEDDDNNSKLPSRQAVSKEVEALKQKLESRRKVRAVPDSVEAARGEVVRCLREKDRRPLDCWKEVEAFKEEVRRLEKGWVEKVVG